MGTTQKVLVFSLVLLSILISVECTEATTNGLTHGTILDAIDLSVEQIAAFVDQHNAVRRQPIPDASNMRKITWDSELANIALQHTRKCLFENNPNTTHSRFRSVGEILFLSQNTLFNNHYISSVVQSFVRGKQHYNVSTQQCSDDTGDCSKYAQIVRAETFKIGCGITQCSTVNSFQEVIHNGIVVICNYAPSGNWQNKAPYLEGKPCSGCHDTDSCERRLCTNAVRDVDPPPSGNWGPWGEWSPCSATCGFSTRRRNRMCDTFVSSDCSGSSSQLSLFCAPIPVCPVHTTPAPTQPPGTWLEWGSWSTCSKTCGGGRRQKSRDCDTGDNRQCDGVSTMLSVCNAQRCPSRNRIPYLGWDKWSECTRSCGGGVRFRSRECPSGNPNACCGVSHSVRDCNTKPCPRAVWTRWGRWQDVGDACSSDTQIRTRKCSTGRTEDCCIQEP